MKPEPGGVGRSRRATNSPFTPKSAESPSTTRSRVFAAPGAVSNAGTNPEGVPAEYQNPSESRYTFWASRPGIQANAKPASQGVSVCSVGFTNVTVADNGAGVVSEPHRAREPCRCTSASANGPATRDLAFRPASTAANRAASSGAAAAGVAGSAAKSGASHTSKPLYTIPRPSTTFL